MADMARVVRLVRKGDSAVLTINGEEFPWWISDTGVTVNVVPHDAPGVTFTLLAERVEVEDEL